MIDRMTFMIKTLVDKHECHRVYNNKEAKVKWIASKFENLVKTNPSIDIKVLGDLLRENYRVSVDVQRLYNAKKKALAGLAKDHAKCFGLLRRYAYMVNQTNPRSTVHICTQDPQPTFQRMFLSFEAQKLGFLEGCRPFIGVDGCHLKGKYPGVLLSAIAVDANSGVFPIAICICEGESKDSWGWFLQQLYCHIGLDDNRRVTFISDRQKGVIDAIERFWPRSNTRHCVRHITANLQAKYKGQLSAVYVWNAANKSNKSDFLVEMENLKEANIDAYNYMINIPLKHWGTSCI